MNIVYRLGLRIACSLLRHPPITSLAWDGRVEDLVERETNLIRQRGDDIKVNCCCDATMVDPIWRPWWRPAARPSSDTESRDEETP